MRWRPFCESTRRSVKIIEMFEAPTLQHVFDHPNLKDGAACCILMAPIFSKAGREEVVPRIGYLDGRSDCNIHFYCAGYGGYWHRDLVPDMEEIGDVKYDSGTMIPWAFSQRLFSDFVDSLEAKTKWRYSGDTELILLDPNVDLTNALVLDVAAMVEDNAIRSSAQLFEAIIQYCRKAGGQPSAYDFSDRQGLREGGKAALDSLLGFLPKPARGVWERGRHYAVKNIAT